MSSREHLAKRAKDAIAGVRDEWDIPTDAALAAGVLNALLPQITEARQMLGVPEGSILIHPVQGGGARTLTWEDGKLLGHSVKYTPEWLIERYGPLTVVWMP
jgi:hypothetical protein